MAEACLQETGPADVARNDEGEEVNRRSVFLKRHPLEDFDEMSSPPGQGCGGRKVELDQGEKDKERCEPQSGGWVSDCAKRKPHMLRSIFYGHSSIARPLEVWAQRARRSRFLPRCAFALFLCSASHRLQDRGRVLQTMYDRDPNRLPFI